MRKKIQSSMILVIALTLIIAYAITTLVVYRQTIHIMEGEVRQEADYINVAIDTSGESYLKIMDKVHKDTRITLIDSDGNVKYDSKEDEVTFQNHKNRPEVKEALKTSKAKKMYVCNIMSEHGETDNYKVSDCINKINSYVEDNFIDTVLVNNEVVPDNIKERYVKEQASPIETDYAKLKDLNVEILEDKLLEIEEDKVRHNPYRTALAIFNYIVKELE